MFIPETMKNHYLLPAILVLALLTIAIGKLSAQDQQLRVNCIERGNHPAECNLRLYGR
jgi:hypothetical protein